MTSRFHDDSASMLILFAGLSLLLYHGFVWLQTGAWQPWTLLDFWCLQYIVPTKDWCAMPSSWQGLHTFLNWLPIWLLSICLALSGLLDTR